MTMEIWFWIGGGIAWLAFGVIGSMGSIAYFQNKYWDVRDRGDAWAWAAAPLGLVTFIVAATVCGQFRYGLAWRATDSEFAIAERKREEAKFRAFKERQAEKKVLR